MLISAPTIILFLRAIYRGNYYMMVYSKAWTHAFCLVEQGTWRETDLDRRKDRFTLTTTMCVFSWVWLFVTSWTVARQAPLFMGFSRQEHRSGLPFPPPGDLPDPGIESVSLTSPALQVQSWPLRHPWVYSSPWQMSERHPGERSSAQWAGG